VDFNNDVVSDSLRTCKAMFDEYRRLVDAGDEQEASRYILYGVRLDTSSSIRDVNVTPLGDPALDLGVNPRQVFTLRQRLDSVWESWDLPAEWRERARNYCKNVKSLSVAASTQKRSAASKDCRCLWILMRLDPTC